MHVVSSSVLLLSTGKIRVNLQLKKKTLVLDLRNILHNLNIHLKFHNINKYIPDQSRLKKYNITEALFWLWTDFSSTSHKFFLISNKSVPHLFFMLFQKTSKLNFKVGYQLHLPCIQICNFICSRTPLSFSFKRANNYIHDASTL